jgi:spore germination cell wall hydrolase CwlJ-like protein
MIQSMSNRYYRALIRSIQSVMILTCAVLAAFLITNVTKDKLQRLQLENTARGPVIATAAERTRQLECLSRNIYWEAASEPFEGKVAVAQVTLNRVEAGMFGNGVCGVVYQKNVFYEKVICQFSWVCDAAVKIRPIHPKLYAESEEVAKKVLLEHFRLPSLSNAIYYHADYVNPGWRKEKIVQIGRHIFYKG